MNQPASVSENGKYSVFTIAKWFLNQDSMDHRKLQKLCYFAEVWYVVFKNQKLYSDTCFEGWVHGPASMNLYVNYKDYGFLQIPKNSTPVKLDEDTEEHLNWVYNIYSTFDGYQLSDVTHKELPWIESRKGIGEFERGSKKLNLDTIRDYYTSLIRTDSV